MTKIKIEDVLPSGEKITITLEGREVDGKRVAQILDMLKILSGSAGPKEDERISLSDLIWDVIQEYYGNGAWFTCRSVYEILRQEYGLDLKISSVATYLLRFYRRGMLDRQGKGYGIKYRIPVELFSRRGSM
ncbi:MAG: hypothetical protein DRJ47_08190 [Thermoprotei archaeon]|nr:MAG: hypothetical protein DRJ47_08190 [Thermoprotei archaeon]